MPEISGIIEAALYVEDMQRSVEFYERICGFPTLFASPRITALRVAPGQVLLIAKKGASAEPSVMMFGVPTHDAAGQQHVAFGVRPEQLGAWRETLQRHGISIEINTRAGVFSSPAVYTVNGEEFVAVASGGRKAAPDR